MILRNFIYSASLCLVFLMYGCDHTGEKKICEQGYNLASSSLKTGLTKVSKKARNRRALSKDDLIVMSALHQLSGLQSHLNLGDIVTYDQYADFKQDFSQYSLWLEQNGCSISDPFFEQVLEDVEKELSWFAPQ